MLILFFTSLSLFFRTYFLHRMPRRLYFVVPLKTMMFFIVCFDFSKQKQKANTLLRFCVAVYVLLCVFLSCTRIGSELLLLFFVESKEADAMFLILPFFSCRKFPFPRSLLALVEFFFFFSLSQLILWGVKTGIMFEMKNKCCEDLTQWRRLKLSLKDLDLVVNDVGF